MKEGAAGTKRKSTGGDEPESKKAKTGEKKSAGKAKK